MKSATFPTEAATDPVARFAALAAQHRATLELALELTDFPSTVTWAHTYLGKLDRVEREIADWGSLGHIPAGVALGTWGRNGHAPAIDGVLSGARHHGKPWRVVWQAARDAERAGVVA